MAIYERDKIVAALEYLNDTLVQARGRENRSIAYDSDLYMAIEKWCEQNSINLRKKSSIVRFKCDMLKKGKPQSCILDVEKIAELW